MPEQAIRSDRRSVEAASPRNLELPAELLAWGCDAELWEKTTNKKGLLDLLKKGDEERGRARIERLREMVRDEDATEAWGAG